MEYQINCEVCGELFIPDGRRKKRCSKDHTRDCSVCGKTFKIISNVKSDREFCSKTCASKPRHRINSCVICGKSFHKISKTCSKKCGEALRARTYTTNAKEKTCLLCEKTFTPTSSTQKYCKNEHKLNCKICRKPFIITDPLSKRKYCSSECASLVINGKEANIKRSKTSLKNYGVENPQTTEELKEKIRKSNIDHYGVAHPMMLDEFKNKAVKTNREKYGVDYTLQDPEIRKKIEKTNIERYGVKNPFSSPEIIKKINKTFMERYGHTWANQSDEIKTKRTATNLERYGVPNVMMVAENIEKANRTFSESVNNGKVTHPKISQLNKNFAKMLETLPYVDNVKFEVGFGIFQADLQINDSLLIDINPTVTHNSFKSFGCVINKCNDTCEKHKKISKNYHYNRSVEALNLNKALIQLYDWDSEENIIRMIKAKLDKSFYKISARKLECRKISQAEANIFLAENHIQGKTMGQSHCYGLFKGTELLAVATFGSSRFNKNYDYEFIRYAVKSGIIIHGGSGRLFSQFINDVKPVSVISYVDFNHTTKDTFLKSLGFKEIKHTGPSLVYYNSDGRKYSNNSLLSVGADKLLKTNYGSIENSGLNNHGIMLLEGFLPIYTAGNRVFVWNQ